MEHILIYIAYILIGVVAGILAGLLGIGGAMVTIPSLLVLFHHMNFPKQYVMHIAIATSLAAMIFNTAASTLAHHRKHHVIWEVFLKLLPGLVLGSVLGALTAIQLSGFFLEIFFGIFLLVMAVRFYRQKPVEARVHELKTPHPLAMNIFSTVIGLLSNVLGIGGGIMTVPLLTAFKMKDRNAIGTSAATTLVTTVVGTGTYLFSGEVTGSTRNTLGWIYVPACLVVGLSSFFAAQYGAHLTHTIDPRIVRRIFAFVLVLVGLSMIFLGAR